MSESSSSSDSVDHFKEIKTNVPLSPENASSPQKLDSFQISVPDVRKKILKYSSDYEKSKRKYKEKKLPLLGNSTSPQKLDDFAMPATAHNVRKNNFKRDASYEKCNKKYENPPLKYKCKRCGDMFSLLNAFKSHKKKHNKHLRQLGLFPNQDRNSLLKNDRTVIQKKLGASLVNYPFYKCNFCSETFHAKKINSHLKFQHNFFQNRSLEKNHSTFEVNDIPATDNSLNNVNELIEMEVKKYPSPIIKDKTQRKSVFERLNTNVNMKLHHQVNTNNLAMSSQKEQDLIKLKIHNFIKAMRYEVEAEKNNALVDKVNDGLVGEGNNMLVEANNNEGLVGEYNNMLVDEANNDVLVKKDNDVLVDKNNVFVDEDNNVLVDNNNELVDKDNNCLRVNDDNDDCLFVGEFWNSVLID